MRPIPKLPLDNVPRMRYTVIVSEGRETQGATEMTKRIGTVEVAKILRKVLKRSFPETKFSVRSSRYTGGSSIDIKWMDGPTGSEVKAVTGYFQGADFDGMTDSMSYRGEWQGETVSFGVDFIFTKRAYSRETLVAAATKVATDYGVSVPEIRGDDCAAWIYDPTGAFVKNTNQRIGDMVFRLLEQSA